MHKGISSLTCPVGRVWVLLAALDSLHGICQCRTSFGPVEKGGIEGMDKNLGGSNWDRPQGHKYTLSPSSQESSSQSHNTICCDLAAGLLVWPAATKSQGSNVKTVKLKCQAWNLVFYPVLIKEIMMYILSTFVCLMNFMSVNQFWIQIFNMVNLMVFLMTLNLH